MNHLHFWCSLKAEVSAREFCDSVREFLSGQYERELIEGFSVARRDFTIDPPGLGEYHITVDFRDAAQASRALDGGASGKLEGMENIMAEFVKDATVAMYRDWPPTIKPERSKKKEIEP
ncbi:MAG: hypothetical protein PHI18_04510 [bacterium]|nr:hypothetical protein [bacterium]